MPAATREPRHLRPSSIPVAAAVPDVSYLAATGSPAKTARSARSDRADQTRANLRASTADGATFGLMVGAGETYFAAFALAVGMGEVSAGLVSSVPLLAGGILQLISLHAVRWVGSEKRWVLFCAGLQSLAFIPLVYAAMSGTVTLGTLLLIASLYWAGGLASGPAWNTWIEAIVPGKVRPRYFASRTRISQLMTLTGLVAAGFLLQWAQSHDRALWGFAFVFCVAGLARVWSVYWLSRHYAPQQPYVTQAKPNRPKVSIANTETRSAAEQRAPMSGIRLLAYLVMVQGMVQISGPFFAPYMLEELNYSYGRFVILLAIGFLAKVIALSWWASVSHRGGAKRLLWIGGIGIIPLSSLWIVSQNFYWLAAVQILSGMLWAAYELGFFLMFFEALPIQRRTRMLTYYNLANTSAWCTGALIGGWLLYSYGAGERGYYMLFGISSLGRLAALGLLVGTSQRAVPILRVGIRVLGIRPAAGMVDSPILPTLGDEHRKSTAVESLQPAA